MNPVNRILSVLSVAAVTLLPVRGADGLQFRHLSHADGLLHDNVTCIAQDSAGFVWFGTHRGLNRYDGYRMDSWKHGGDPINSVYYNRIYSMTPAAGYMWLATEAGLACFDMDKKRFVDYAVADSTDVFWRDVCTVSPALDGLVWMACDERVRLVRISSGSGDGKPVVSVIKIGGSNSYRSDMPGPCMACDTANGRVWFSGSDRLAAYIYDGSRLIYEGAVPSVSGGGVQAMCHAGGMLWTAYSDRVCRYAAASDGSILPAGEVLVDTEASINSMTMGRDCVWIGAGDGVFRIDRGQDMSMECYRHSASDAWSVVSDVNGLLTDSRGNLWVSGWTAGVAYANPLSGKFGTLRYPADGAGVMGSAGSEFVNAIHASSDGYIYIGSKFSGLSRISSATRKAQWNWCRSRSLIRNITSICSDRDYIYAAVGGEVVAVDKRTGTEAGITGVSRGGYIFDMAFDRNGHLWVATYAGLERMTRINGRWCPDLTFTSSDPEPCRLSTDQLHNIYSDTVRNELIITSAMGINRVILAGDCTVERIIRYTARADGSGLSSNYVWPLDKGDGELTYWVGTMGSGLNKVTFDDSTGGYTAECYGRGAGARSDDIESIEVDCYGRVWCAGSYLSYFDPAVGRFNSYDASDGLQGNAFGTSSSAQDAGGTMWFGGVGGLNYFTPEREPVAPVLTDVVFSHVKGSDIITEAEGHNRGEVRLYYPDNQLSVDFTTLSFGTQQHVRYRYRLEGYDDNWRYIEPGSAPAIFYDKLPYGNMELKVEAGDWQDWSGNPAVLKVVSCPPWWMTAWAYMLYVIIFCVLGWIGIRWFLKWNRMKRIIAVRQESERQQEEMLCMKMRFFTDVSHEFRTPLTLIRHAVADLTEDEAMADNRSVNVIARNTGTLSNMVNELLDFHRADMRSTPLRTTLTSVVPMVANIYSEFRGWAEDVDIDMNLTVADPEIEMWIDREQLSKILGNILSNSIRYTGSGGHVDVWIGTGLYQEVTPAFADSFSIVGTMIPGRQLIIRVRDTGIGIAADALPTIFERFRRISGSGRHGGSGIGLALVKSLVGLHRGGITVSSAEGQGTEMIVFLPMTYDYLTDGQKTAGSTFSVDEYMASFGVEFARVGLSEIPASVNREGEPLLLIVDDNPEILAMLAEYMGREYNVETASGGTEAMHKAQQLHPDIIISDVMMPEPDGIQLCTMLRTDLQTCHIPVILLTAKSDEEDRIAGIESGADAYISKPFNPRLLRATVANLLARSRRARSTVERTPHSIRGEIADRRQRELFDRFVELVRANLSNPDFSVDDIWRTLGLNRTRLFEFVKSTTGVSLGNYIRKLRLDRAAELLLSTDMSVSEVGFNVGIESPAYFTRSFKEQFGMSPTEYIKSHSKD